MYAFAVITLIFVYTTLANIVERPDGVKIGGFFIAAIVIFSILSRLLRAFELRVDATWTSTSKAEMFLRDCARRSIRLVANEPDARTATSTARRSSRSSTDNDLPDADDLIFVEVTVTDPSDFEGGSRSAARCCTARYRVHHYRVATVPNALAALLLQIRDVTGVRPHIYFEWTEGNPPSTSCASCSSGSARSRPSPGKCSGAPSQIPGAARTCMPVEPCHTCSTTLLGGCIASGVCRSSARTLRMRSARSSVRSPPWNERAACRSSAATIVHRPVGAHGRGLLPLVRSRKSPRPAWPRSGRL